MLQVREGKSHKFSNAKLKGMLEKSLKILCPTPCMYSEKPFSKGSLAPAWAVLENKERAENKVNRFLFFFFF